MSGFRTALTVVVLVAAAPLAAAQEKKPLVTRARVQLNLAGAETVLEAAKTKAAALGLKWPKTTSCSTSISAKKVTRACAPSTVQAG